MDSRPVEVPVSAHIKKFCDSFFGSPIRLDDSSSHRVAMKVFLSAHMQMDMFYKHEPLRILPNTIYLEITRKKYQHICIHKQNLQQIVKYIDKIFEEKLDEYVQQHACKKSHSNGYKKHVEDTTCA